MEDSRNIIKAIDALTLKAGGDPVDSKNIIEAIDNLKAVYDQKAIGIDKTLTQEGLAADAKAVGDKLSVKRMYSTDTPSLLSVQFENPITNTYGSLCVIFADSENSTRSFCAITLPLITRGYQMYVPLAYPNGIANIRCIMRSDRVTFAVTENMPENLYISTVYIV